MIIAPQSVTKISYHGRLATVFKLSEFTRSATAKKRGVTNDPPESVVENLRNLCNEVLEPLREHFGVPIIITSGYRSALLNSLVGGSKNSQHKYGEAADIFIPKYDFIASDGERHTNIDIARTWFEWLRTNTDFDQLILETSNRKDFWLHVSCRCDRRLNRHNHIAYLIKSN